MNDEDQEREEEEEIEALLRYLSGLEPFIIAIDLDNVEREEGRKCPKMTRIQN